MPGFVLGAVPCSIIEPFLGPFPGRHRSSGGLPVRALKVGPPHSSRAETSTLGTDSSRRSRPKWIGVSGELI